ncbi:MULTISPECIES: fructosamine kinase family protein [unclassified Vibrio]|uniref:Fructosamine kinase family protein n=1 Tax=Vibrio sp. HB236076 TaxID=3232307 RepID=A0AB39HCA9_9VIBR|nr:fructosamine kinase family protein [Vibrio sp. HB161653]MDP5253423.1 fructosamine kinase family protein [Vibrio sp. HB161653]
MWQSIAEQISHSLGYQTHIESKTKFDKLGLFDHYRLTLQNGQCLYLKLTDKSNRHLLESEFDTCQTLANTQTLIPPEAISLGQCKEGYFLYYPWQTEQPLCIKSSSQLGIQLAKLHNWGEQKQFGFDSDNYIVSTLQPNRWTDKWADFFAEQRIGWLLALLAEQGLYFGQVDDFVEQTKQRLKHHQPVPSLIHGHLCPENIKLTPQGPRCIQPACYWGDAECDLAMLEFNSPLPDSFYQAYLAYRPLAHGYEERRHLYRLYYRLLLLLQYGGQHLESTQQELYELFQ